MTIRITYTRFRCIWYRRQIIIIWNRQKKRCFPACEAAVKFHFFTATNGRETPWKGHRPWTRTGGGKPPTGPSPPGPPLPLAASLLRERCNVTPHVNVCSTNKRHLTSAPRQTNSRFIFPVLYKVSYGPRQLHRCLYKNAEFTGRAFGCYIVIFLVLTFRLLVSINIIWIKHGCRCCISYSNLWREVHFVPRHVNARRQFVKFFMTLKFFWTFFVQNKPQLYPMSCYTL